MELDEFRYRKTSGHRVYQRPIRMYRITHHEISEKEIEKLKEQFATSEMDVDEFEEKIAKWLYWETLNPFERRKFEDENKMPQIIRLSKDTGKKSL